MLVRSPVVRCFGLLGATTYFDACPERYGVIQRVEELGPLHMILECKERKAIHPIRFIRKRAPTYQGVSNGRPQRLVNCASNGLRRAKPPPPPKTPYAVEVSRDYVRLAWDNSADFAGAPPIPYQLEQMGNLRNNGTWEPVFPPWYHAVVSQTV